MSEPCFRFSEDPKSPGKCLRCGEAHLEAQMCGERYQDRDGFWWTCRLPAKHALGHDQRCGEDLGYGTAKCILDKGHDGDHRFGDPEEPPLFDKLARPGNLVKVVDVDDVRRAVRATIASLDVPSDWSIEQIAEFKRFFDAIIRNPLTRDTTEELHARLAQISKDKQNAEYKLARLVDEEGMIAREIYRRCGNDS